MSAYADLHQRHQRLHRLSHLKSIAQWDQSANMPAKGNEARSLALAEMGGLLHQLATEPALQGLLEQAEGETLDDDQRANLREMRRVWRASNALPQALVEAKSLATSRCEHDWRSQRPANDWTGYLENLREVVRLARDEARWNAQQAEIKRKSDLEDTRYAESEARKAPYRAGGLQTLARLNAASQPTVTPYESRFMGQR